ncbi:MAG: ribonuclease H-like domain-containing protein [Betaproteobacteria bacterium]
MDLRSRLQELEARLGVGQRAAEPASVTADAASVPLPLAARLQRMAAVSAARPPRRSVSQDDLAQLLDGTVCADGVVLVEHVLPLSQRHGRVAFSLIRESSLDFLAGGAEPDRESLLFIDTETTGLAGGTGTVALVLGLARIRGDAIHTRQYFLTCFAGESAMLAHALGWITTGCHLVSFNGKSFDVPLLATRFRLARLTHPLSDLPHMDLLHRTRAAYKRNWPDCRLQTAEQMLLKLFRDDDDVPGHLIPQIWTDLLQHGETRHLRGVVDHNRIDILSLIALSAVLGTTYAMPGQEYADPLGIARAHRRAGDAQSALRHLEDSPALSADARLELAALYARSGRWDEALPIWDALAQQNVLCAMERLAIYHEHRQRDFERALHWTERMRPQGVAGEAIERRHARLVRKSSRQA